RTQYPDDFLFADAEERTAIGAALLGTTRDLCHSHSVDGVAWRIAGRRRQSAHVSLDRVPAPAVAEGCIRIGMRWSPRLWGVPRSGPHMEPASVGSAGGFRGNPHSSYRHLVGLPGSLPGSCIPG